MGHYDGLVVPEDRNEPLEVADDFAHAVRADLGGLARQVESAHVRRDYSKPRRRQRSDLKPPGVPEVGEAMQEHDRPTRAGLHHVQPGISSAHFVVTNDAAEAGAFELELPPNRRVFLRALEAGFADASLELETGGGADISGVELVLRRGQELELDVTLWSGLRPERVMVALVDESGRRVMGDGLNSLLPGSFRIDSAPEGDWTLIIGSDWSAVVEQRVSIPGPPVPLVLPQGAEIMVESLHSGAPSTGETLRLVSPAGRTLRLPVSLRRLSDFPFFAQAHIPWVPPGNWQVELVSPSGEVRRKSVLAVAGETAQVTFD